MTLDEKSNTRDKAAANLTFKTIIGKKVSDADGQ